MEQAVQFTARIMSALYKVFADREPVRQPECTALTALRGETVSFQAAYSVRGGRGERAVLRVQSPLEGSLRVREVLPVPCGYPAHPETDDNYLRTEPGLYPDLLREPGAELRFVPGQWKALWIDVRVEGDQAPGDYPVRISFCGMDGEELCRAQTKVTVYGATLPEQVFPRTEWFHGDCLADYYGVPVFSGEHWEIMERFVRQAAQRGINMILTPQFTPPLDTAKGGERTAIQLVGVQVDDGAYTFDFSRLERWVEMCRRAGMRYFEMSHLFTQWGAEAAPNIMARVNGEERRIFGWDTPAVGGEYTRFLGAYLPALTRRLREWGIADRTIFHISDEPERHQLESYRAAKRSVEPLLRGFPIRDALSDYAFYKEGVLEGVVCATDHIREFIEGGVEDLWAYYCTAQHRLVSNRFVSMPLARTRIYGVQLFRYNIKGSLHWGYNFYNNQHSLRPLNPYEETDCGGAYPSGDAFLVYPGKGGIPEESVRMMVLYHAMTDLRALEYLAELAGRDYACALLEEGLGEPLTFTSYPTGDAWLITLRNRVNREIAARTGAPAL